jgi:gluconate 2-dehydrogenase gamma chain
MRAGTPFRCDEHGVWIATGVTAAPGLPASHHLNMSDSNLPILSNSTLAERVSPVTRHVLEQRAEPIVAPQYLSAELYATLQQVIAVILPQDAIGTSVDIAAAIDQRLAQDKSSGWRFADLPRDGEAYRVGLTIFAAMLAQTPMKQLDHMPQSAREGYLRCIANGDIDGHARFPLSKWLLLVKTDTVKTWLSHPSAMQKIDYAGFADGATGTTDGPTQTEGWSVLIQDSTLPFERTSALTERGA